MHGGNIMSQNLTKFNNIMNRSAEIALATSVDNMPRVRVVNFVYDGNTPGVVYFSTNLRSAKVLDFRENNHVAFTTFEKDYVRVRSAVVEASGRDKEELRNLMIKKLPWFEEIFEKAREHLAFYEIHFDTAAVHLGISEPDIVYFQQNTSNVK
jgi:uncharacterized pyridoxamine 5'-phosphate oxidase family protein